MTLEELEMERLKNEQRLLELQDMYQRKKEGGGKSRANVSIHSGRGSASHRSFNHEKKKSV